MFHDPDVARRAAELVSQHGVHTVECAFPDTWGALRGKRIPASQFASMAAGGFAIANAAFVWDPLCGIFDTTYTNPGTGYPDMIAVPDLETFRPLTWREGAAVVMCNEHEVHGPSPIPLDPRHVLRTAEGLIAAHGYTATVATELEFYLTDEQWNPLYPDVQCYSITKGAELEHIMADIRREVEAFGIVVEACNTEYGPAQIEVNLRYGSPMEVADNTVLFKYAVKEIARRHGTRATFMAKPFMGQSGNGTHLHVSLRDASGRNAFDGDEPLMMRCVAGLLAHQLELAGIGSPSINAYRRFEDYSFAPTYVNWGGDNRQVAIRTVTDHGAATRIEIRTAAADANPYLLAAGQLAAVADALATEHVLLPACHGDGYAVQECPLLPRSLQDAVRALEGGSLLRRSFGDAFVTNLTELLQHEVDEFSRQVTEWEKTRYMEVS